VKDKAFILDLSWVGECQLHSDIWSSVKICQLQSRFVGRSYLCGYVVDLLFVDAICTVMWCSVGPVKTLL